MDLRSVSGDEGDCRDGKPRLTDVWKPLETFIVGVSPLDVEKVEFVTWVLRTARTPNKKGDLWTTHKITRSAGKTQTRGNSDVWKKRLIAGDDLD